MCEPVTRVLREIIIYKCNKDKILQTELFAKGQFIDPLYELHVRGNAANLGDRTRSFTISIPRIDTSFCFVLQIGNIPMMCKGSIFLNANLHD